MAAFTASSHASSRGFGVAVQRRTSVKYSCLVPGSVRWVPCYRKVAARTSRTRRPKQLLTLLFDCVCAGMKPTGHS